MKIIPFEIIYSDTVGDFSSGESVAINFQKLTRGMGIVTLLTGNIGELLYLGLTYRKSDNIVVTGINYIKKWHSRYQSVAFRVEFSECKEQPTYFGLLGGGCKWEAQGTDEADNDAWYTCNKDKNMKGDIDTRFVGITNVKNRKGLAEWIKNKKISLEECKKAAIKKCIENTKETYYLNCP